MADLPLFIQALASRYPLVEVSRHLGNRDFVFTCVRDQDALLAGLNEDTAMDYFPFGLLLWPASIGLAEHLLETPTLIAGKRVLELGVGGMGLPGLVAVECGAKNVLQTDYHIESLKLLAYNTEQNGLTGHVQQQQADWRDFPELGQPFDVVIGSDVLYEQNLHLPLLNLLPRLVAPGGILLLSDPIRPQALTFIERLEKEYGTVWELPVTMRGHSVREPNGKIKEIALFTLQKNFQ